MLSCVSAMRDATISVMAASTQTMVLSDGVFAKRSTPKMPVNTRMIEKTPTFTTATACSSALTGAGATIAPGSQA